MEEIWPSPTTKAPVPTENSKKQSDNTKRRLQNLRLNSDCGSTEDGQSRSSDNHRTGVV